MFPEDMLFSRYPEFGVDLRLGFHNYSVENEGVQIQIARMSRKLENNLFGLRNEDHGNHNSRTARR
jgi:hypothetical protein